MTQEPPPTLVDDIVVRGQRRWPGGTFPTLGGGGGYGEDPEGPSPIEVGQEPDPPTSTDPCADPATAIPWNTDAAAAEAAKAFAEDAARMGEDGLNHRERGAYIIQRPDGTITIGPIHYSDPFGSDGDNSHVFVDLTYRDIDPSWIIGSVHSHPTGAHRPSGPGPSGIGGDIDHFAGVQQLMQFHGRDPADAVLYVVAQNQVGGGQTPYNQINVYDQTNIEESQTEFEVGPEVNPDAMPCP